MSIKIMTLWLYHPTHIKESLLNAIEDHERVVHNVTVIHNEVKDLLDNEDNLTEDQSAEINLVHAAELRKNLIHLLNHTTKL